MRVALSVRVFFFQGGHFSASPSCLLLRCSRLNYPSANDFKNLPVSCFLTSPGAGQAGLVGKRGTTNLQGSRRTGYHRTVSERNLNCVLESLRPISVPAPMVQKPPFTSSFVISNFVGQVLRQLSTFPEPHQQRNPSLTLRQDSCSFLCRSSRIADPCNPFFGLRSGRSILDLIRSSCSAPFLKSSTVPKCSGRQVDHEIPVRFIYHTV